jgi:hypothetical protein
MESIAASITRERGRSGPKQGGLAGPMHRRAAPLARPAHPQPSRVGEHGLARARPSQAGADGLAGAVQLRPRRAGPGERWRGAGQPSRPSGASPFFFFSFSSLSRWAIKLVN